jgi:hypothetical protein
VARDSCAFAHVASPKNFDQKLGRSFHPSVHSFITAHSFRMCGTTLVWSTLARRRFSRIAFTLRLDYAESLTIRSNIRLSIEPLFATTLASTNRCPPPCELTASSSPSNAQSGSRFQSPEYSSAYHMNFAHFQCRG